SGGSAATAELAAPEFVAAFGGGGAATLAALLGGELLVGFGTRMAGGCTSGHGLCGVSRAQPGSLIATATFFGGGIAVSLLLRGLLG
ncbi:MAG: YeeE/YedE family protein, partial [Deltaproteobacteria bacterium]|nr:YeeE/YedE family protein [Deltaproteobacteria bacterium]